MTMAEQQEQFEKASTALSMHGAGLLLAQAREKAGMSQEEAATQLRLSPRQLKALEEGDMAALPSPAFVRGFIRNYAKLLQIDAAPLLEACRAHAPGTAQGQISLHSENILIAGRSRKGWLPYAAALLFLCVALGAWLAFTNGAVDQEDKAEPVATAPQPVPAPVPVEVLQPLPADPAVAGPVPPVSPEAAAVQQPATVATAEPVPSPEPSQVASAPGNAVLKLSFIQAGWVGVRDRDGKEIFNKTAQAGSEETVGGVPPFSLVLGNASGVRITYKDKPVDLAPHTKANVARLTLE
jgi:cytoskeleton protein RodZ